MKRVTYKTIQERENNKSEYSDLPKLKDIIVNLSVKNTPKVEKNLRLIGLPIMFFEYSDKKRRPNEKNAFDRVPFPDASRNSKLTRIGLANDEGKADRNDPWYQMGYVPAKKYAIRCLEKQDDGTWVPKILVKGPSVFDFFFSWEESQRISMVEEEDENTSIYIGHDKAPTAKIIAVADDNKLGGVDYKVFMGKKDMALTEEHINLLRAVREPSADELNKLREEYNKDREEDDSMPEWRDYFAYSHDIDRIFKPTPPVEDKPQTSNASSSQTSSASTEEEDEGDDEFTEVVPAGGAASSSEAKDETFIEEIEAW